MAINNKLLGGATGDTPSSLDPRDHFGTVLYTGTGASQSINGGKYDAGAGFNGSSSKIALADNTFKYTALTISAWIYPSGSGDRCIIETYNYTSSPGSQGWILKVDNATNKLLMRAYNGDCGSAYPTDNSCTNVTEVYSNSAISTSAWTHIAITLDSSNMKMYINGTAQTGNTGVATNGFTYNASTKTTIGCFRYGSAADEQFFNGKIDHLRMYDEVLSASEVGDLASESYDDSFKVNFPTGKSATALYRLNGNANDETNVHDGTASNVTWKYGVNFTPDMVWIKRRSSTEPHALYDSIRGANKQLEPDDSDAEATNSAPYQGLTAFDSGGFTVGPNGGVNSSSETYVGWCFNAGTDAAATNNDGSLQSTVKANTDAGFSIVKYDYPHTDSSTVRTVGHGLNTAPSLIIVKNLEHASSWFVYSEALGNGYEVYLNSANGVGTDGNRWNSTSPTTGVITLGTSFSSYAADYYGGGTIAYCFHDVDGYQKTGSYTGNGSAHGPMIETGFKPAFLLIKCTSHTGTSWRILDDKRNPSNPVNKYFSGESNAAEATGNHVNFYDDGFQVITTDTSINGSGRTQIYLAIAAPPETITPVLAKSFKVLQYTGDGTTENVIDGVGFSPDLIWIKAQGGQGNNLITDKIRGPQKEIYTNLNAAEYDRSSTNNGLRSINPDGFTVGDDSNGSYSVNGGSGGTYSGNPPNYISYNWKASGSTDILTGSGSNNDVLASINDDAGFSILTYRGTGSSGMKIRHGLSATPAMVIVKKLDANPAAWMVWFDQGLTDFDYYLNLNTDSAQVDSIGTGFSAAPDANLLTFGTSGIGNDNNLRYVAYCWRRITGYSAFGSYTATGSAGSPTITTGFQPNWVMVKNVDRVQEWVIIDSVRGLGNTLRPDSDTAEYTGNSITVNSTSFTINVAGGGVNYASGDTFIYAAFKMN